MRYIESLKTTRREIANLVKLGVAKDITNASVLPKFTFVVKYSVGVNGINAVLVKDSQGELYAVLERNSNLFILI